MNKKFLKSIIMGLVLILVIFSIPSNTVSAKSKSSETSAADKALKKKLKKLYKSYNSNKKEAWERQCNGKGDWWEQYNETISWSKYDNSFDILYAYVDLDGDKTKELLVYEESSPRLSSFAYDVKNKKGTLKIYKFTNGKVKSVLNEKYDGETIIGKSMDYPATFYGNYKYMICRYSVDDFEFFYYNRSAKGNYIQQAYLMDGEEMDYYLYDKNTKSLKYTDSKKFSKFETKVKNSGECTISWEIYKK